ncbi:hypothetical protein CHH28_10480 [Bacterioplanes sanyensis]|uniref:Solute-binding protein family 3/N-terminal domain-containing protein n=1 Tax=Bacterioplanes sanyensis TaxID=1249553 RepID=A0A222FK08_9GAMM|nr:transporter substrate-binding domain-containing protein [Bacterioplanes sanyensis]ASP39079.1 hypothetical protein CHH28_10480 [Bacterioplanes sanyensis]
MSAKHVISSLCLYCMCLLLPLHAQEESQIHQGSQTQEALLIGTEHYPPYEMEQPIEGLRGFDYEVVSRVFEQLELDIDIQFYPWKRVLHYAESGHILGIMTCAYRPEREAFIIFSDPISDYNDGFYVRRGFAAKSITKLSDFRGTRVASVDGYESYKALVSAGAQPIKSKTTEMAVQMLKRERFDYLYLGQQATDFVIKKLGMSESFDFYSLEQHSFYFCFSRQHPKAKALVDAFNQALKALKANGEYQAIHAKYR